MNNMPNFSNSWVREIEGKLTFCGATELLFDEICQRNYWRADRTIRQYTYDYDRRIFSSLQDHNEKTLEQYTEYDYQEAIENIKNKAVNGRYSEITIQHFRHLIEVVVTAASEYGYCSNVLWGSCFTLPEEFGAEERISELVKLKKSFTPEQEIMIAQNLMGSVDQSGPLFALLLMFASGARNGEACAADFGDILTLEDAGNIHVLMIYKTVESRENRLISSGKTKNADRIIPLPDQVYEILMRRKEYVQIQKNCDEAEVNRYPIASSENDICARCTPDIVSAAGKNLFKAIGLNGNVLAYIDAEIEKGNDPVYIKEKDPTTYLFRRNYATQLHIVGMDESEIEYLIGHDIDDSYETRNEYVNAERLQIMDCKLRNRAVFNDSEFISVSNDMSQNGERPFDARLMTIYKLHFYAGKATIRVSTKEPWDMIRLRVEAGKEKDSYLKKVRTYSVEPYYSPDRTINISVLTHKCYRSKRKKKM